MDKDQQFSLRFNNHQSTLVAVFDSLLENETFVDCTLAAEGKSLNAHKVVLSACSPFFESLLSRHYDKHPILILKDVKFHELKAMMEYMYRGVVNIPQDQLGALLKAAESLQIKGLPHSSNEQTDTKAASTSKNAPPQTSIPKMHGESIEKRTRDDKREGSKSPTPRKKKRIRRKSDELDNYVESPNSSESSCNEMVVQNISFESPVPKKLIDDVPVKSVDIKSETILEEFSVDPIEVSLIKEELEYTETMVEPKSEDFKEENVDGVENWTIFDDDDDDDDDNDDDDEMSNMELIDDGAGPSHGNAAEGSSQEKPTEKNTVVISDTSRNAKASATTDTVYGKRILKELQGIFQEAENELGNLSLPDKSKVKYMSVYDKFMEWRLEKNLTSLSEDVLLTYFKELSSTFKPSSLLAMYSMLKTMLSAKHNIDLKTYTKLITFIKKSNVGFKSRKAKVFTADEVDKFLTDASDYDYLVHKVALIFGINGACRSNELCNLRTKDVVEYENSMILVKLPSPKPCIERSFTVTDVFYEIVKKYMALRPSNAKSDRFFISYQKGKCTQQPIGINRMGGYPKVIANYLSLSDAQFYTGHSFRRTSAKLLANVGTNLTAVKRSLLSTSFSRTLKFK